MKIAYVTDAIYPYNKGGKEKRLFELSVRLANMGNDVHIYTMHWWEGPEKSRVENGVTLHAICKRYDMYNGETRSIKEALLFSLACFKVFNVKADIYDVDHMPFFPIISSWIALKLRGRKLHGSWHEVLSRRDWTSYMGPAGLVAYFVQSICLRLPYHITVSSQQTFDTLRNEYGRSNTSLVPPGIDLKLLETIKPATVRSDILYVGRLVRDKSVDVLIEAVAIIKRSQPNVTCLIVGHGVEMGRLKSQIKRLKLAQNVRLLAPISKDSDIYRQMKAAKVFAFPSIREGFGIVALESLGCGTPVVTSSAITNAAQYLVTDGLNGSVVDTTPQTLAPALLKWIENKKPLAKTTLLTGYDWAALTEAQLEVYQA